MKKITILFFTIILSVLLFQSCEDRTDLTAPTINPDFGNVDFTRFVAIGNSLTAGYQSGALYKSSQEYSFGKLIADQVGTKFEQPLISDPGIGGRIEVVSLNPFTTRVNSTIGSPLNSNYAAPYNNLGVPGAVVYDMIDTSDFQQKSADRGNPFFLIVLRNPALGKSVIQQAIAENPTFMTVDIGNNDVLGYATSGGTRGTDQTGKLPTESTIFAYLYSQMTTAIATALPNTKVALANIPNVNVIPFFTTVGPQISHAASLGKALNGVGLFYQKNGEDVGTGTADSLALISGQVLITLTASAYAPLLGQPTGKWYVDNGYPALPAGIDTTKPFGFHPQNPWPDALTLDPNEQAVVSNAVTAYNSTIAGIVSANPNFVLVDINGLLNRIRSNDFTGGTVIDGLTFRTFFVQGGLFGLDGVHPTSRGYAVFANEFIKSINSKFGVHIPLVNVATVPASLILTNPNLSKIGDPIHFNGPLKNLFF